MRVSVECFDPDHCDRQLTEDRFTSRFLKFKPLLAEHSADQTFRIVFNYTGPKGLELQKLRGRPKRLVDRRSGWSARTLIKKSRAVPGTRSPRIFLINVRAGVPDKNFTAIITAQSAWIGYPVKWAAAHGEKTLNFIPVSHSGQYVWVLKRRVLCGLIRKMPVIPPLNRKFRRLPARNLI